jgi:hypothetical protein
VGNVRQRVDIEAAGKRATRGERVENGLDLLFYGVPGDWSGTLYLDDIVIAAP